MTANHPPSRHDIFDVMEEGERELTSSIVSKVSQDREYVLWHLRQLEEEGVVERVHEREASEPLWKSVDPPKKEDWPPE